VQQILEPDAPEHLSPHAIRDTVDDFGPVLGRIDVHAKRSSAEGCIDYFDDGFGYRTGVGIGGFQARETLEGRVL